MTGGEGGSGAAPQPERPAPTCPICGKPAGHEAPPFCSRRCANVDLHRWLSGAYAIPAASEDTDEEEREEPQ